jgi:hypothetical protein
MSEPRSPIIVAEDLSKRYGDLQAGGGISFSVERGEILGLLGLELAPARGLRGRRRSLRWTDAGRSRASRRLSLKAALPGTVCREYHC